jgi:hypothetical protein
MAIRAFALLLLAAAARGDGCMLLPVGRSSAVASSPRQEAILRFDGETVAVTLRTHFRGGPGEVAWVVPVPAEPEGVTAEIHDPFPALEQATAPRFYAMRARGGCGCAGMAAAPAEEARSVTVVRSGEAGIYRWAALRAGDAGALERWLGENGFQVPPEAARAFAPYVSEGWHWLAMRVRAGVGEAELRAPQPVTYRYRSKELVYPLRISALSAEEENEILVYVAAAGSAAPVNFSHVTSEFLPVRRKAGAASGTDYEDLLRELSAESRGRLFVTEWSGTAGALLPGAEGLWLTRLRALLPRGAMDADLRLRAGPARREVTGRFYVAGDAPHAAVATLVFAAGLLGAFRGSLRRRSPSP